MARLVLFLNEAKNLVDFVWNDIPIFVDLILLDIFLGLFQLRKVVLIFI